MEAWEVVLIDGEAYAEDVHASIGCTTCHGGTSGTEDMEAAHTGVVRDPDPATCGTCHSEIVGTAADSLHWSLQGYMGVLEARGSAETMPQLMEAYENHCATCHASCGQCHVSRPTSAGGGLLNGHVFRGTPPPYSTCTGCHGSRIESEYKGKNENEAGGTYPADVHYNPGGMNCNDCHTGDEMHGTMGAVDDRYDGGVIPSCSDEGCHEGIGNGDGIAQHTPVHLEQMSCQVCHATTYKNCYNCHVELSADGVPFFRTDESEMMFLIGLNPIQSEERPWQYVPLRHVPISTDSFSFYGENLLPNFDALPTWTYATPHNIQRQTPQNASCTACHGNDSIFLTAEDVDPDELAANQLVIVTDVPMALGAAPAEDEEDEEPAEGEAPSTEEPVEGGVRGVAPVDAYSGPETCAACHADRYEMWGQGPHANALDDPVFQEAWAATDNARYCLACHATGYDPNTGEYATDAVTCEACHGPYDAGHPPALQHVDRTGQICQNCHPQTYTEWQNSRHGQVGTGCLSCHQICSLETARAEDGHAVCETCHSGSAEDFHQSTHDFEGLDCTDCHMHEGPGELGHGGYPHIAHNFLQNPESCVDCHAETIHLSSKIIDTEARIADLDVESVERLEGRVQELEEEANALQSTVTGRLYAGLLAGAIAGLAVGFGGGQMWRRWQGGRPL
ncbi:MAG: hypothetical protein JXD18_05800 [Anaerolineae bacterium]|nr:hypothetical protein [Anaerolineae bacterium]